MSGTTTSPYRFDETSDDAKKKELADLDGLGEKR